MGRYIGVDLHRNCFTACVRWDNGRSQLGKWKLSDLNKFVFTLRSTDEVAVEATGNTRFFYDAVWSRVRRVVVVNPHQFKVISESVNKTDKSDARNLALFLSKGLLPEVRMRDKQHAGVAKPGADAGQAGQASDLVKEQDQQSCFGARCEPEEGISFQREGSSGGSEIQV